MSLQLATKGVLDGGVTHATKGVIYLQGIIIIISTVIPQFIVRRVGTSSIVRRIATSKIIRREND